MVISLNEEELSRDKTMFEICLSIGTSYRHASIYMKKELSRDKAMFEICLSVGTSYSHASIYVKRTVHNHGYV